MNESEFAVGDSALLKISIRSGRVSVESGEPGSVSISVDTRDPTFEVRQRGDVIVAAGDRGDRTYVTARVPAISDIEISTASADVNVEAGLRRLEVSSASGDITFDSTHTLETKSASGGVTGRQVSGEARCVTASGSIRIEELLELADLSTASGNINVDRCAGSLICATTSGNIKIGELTGPSANIKSMSGAVRIGIPTGTRLDLDANTFSGKVTLPSPNPSPEPPEREITARVRLVSGDLRIDRTG